MQKAVKFVPNVRINLVSCLSAVALMAVGGSAFAATNIYVSPTGACKNDHARRRAGIGRFDDPRCRRHLLRVGIRPE